MPPFDPRPMPKSFRDRCAALRNVPPFLRLVWRTNRFSFDPPDVYDVVEPEMPTPDTITQWRPITTLWAI